MDVPCKTKHESQVAIKEESSPTWWPKIMFIGKLFFIGFLTIMMELPMKNIESLIGEREDRKQSVANEVLNTWGHSQRVGGPILTIPYISCVERDTKSNICKKSAKYYAHFLPHLLEIAGSLRPEVRHRGIYQVLLYQTDLQFKGHFFKPAWESLHLPDAEILWDEAMVSVGLTELKGLQAQSEILWDGQRLPLDTAVSDNGLVRTRIEAPVKNLQEIRGPVQFAFSLKLVGSERLEFLPLGKETKVHLSSTWDNPSFIGNTLPLAHEVNAQGFKAQWKVLHWARNYPQQWKAEAVKAEMLEWSAFGVELLFPVNTYQKTTRAAKYAILFILLTFVTFFLFEILQKDSVHFIQYLLVGFAICLFFLLLLSLSEHLPFVLSYFIATMVIVLLVGGYTRYILHSSKKSLVVAAALAGLYGYLYILLQLQDYALLMGSLGLVLILALIMFITRNIDWHQLQMKYVKSQS